MFGKGKHCLKIDFHKRKTGSEKIERCIDVNIVQSNNKNVGSMHFFWPNIS